MGAPRSSRPVGYALHVNPAPGVIPCHRVVNRFGALAASFAFGGAAAQAPAQYCPAAPMLKRPTL